MPDEIPDGLPKRQRLSRHSLTSFKGASAVRFRQTRRRASSARLLAFLR